MPKSHGIVCIAVGLLLLGAVAAPTPALAAGGGQGDEPRLGIKGYDPVAYFTVGRPVRGKPEFHHDLDEVRYRFASTENLALFRADPDRYAPRFGGLCAMGLGAKGYKVEANPENWAIHKGRLYVFQRSFGRPGFRKDPERWAASAKSNLQVLADRPMGSGLSWW